MKANNYWAQFKGYLNIDRETVAEAQLLSPVSLKVFKCRLSPLLHPDPFPVHVDEMLIELLELQKKRLFVPVYNLEIIPPANLASYAQLQFSWVYCESGIDKVFANLDLGKVVIQVTYQNRW